MIVPKTAIRLPIVPYPLAVLVHISIYKIVMTARRCCYNINLMSFTSIYRIRISRNKKSNIAHKQLSIIPAPFYHAPLLPAGQLVEVHLGYLI